MKLDIRPLEIPDVKLIRVARMTDERGYFLEAYVRRDFIAAGIDQQFIQDNQSRSHTVGTVRGLHFQLPPFAQTKLIWVLRGRILDVVVDLRASSPHFGKHLAVELSAETGDKLLVPIGFAHGFCTLEPETEVLYKVDAVYSPGHDRGINWRDPALGIRWPVSAGEAIVSERDNALPLLSELPPCFE